MKLIKIDNENQIIKKHNELIHNAKYSLSELSIKILNCLIAMIKIDDTNFQEYHLDINEFKGLIGSNSKDTYKYTHNLIKELLSNPIKIGDKQFNWISFGEYVEGSNIIKFEIHHKLRPYLLELKEDFTQYNIKDILSLKSSYVIRFYELLISRWRTFKNYNAQKHKFVFEIEIDFIIKTLEIPQSQKYADIKRYILEKSKKQFNDKTCIRFSYREIKLGRKVVKLEITIQDNLLSLEDFIRYLRKNLINTDLYKAIDKETGKEMLLSVSPDGRLYDKYRYEFEFDTKRAFEIYKALHKLFLEYKLNIDIDYKNKKI